MKKNGSGVLDPLQALPPLVVVAEHMLGHICPTVGIESIFDTFRSLLNGGGGHTDSPHMTHGVRPVAGIT